MVSFTPRPSYYRGKRPWYPLKAKVGELHTHQLMELHLSANRLLIRDISILRVKVSQLHVSQILQNNC